MNKNEIQLHNQQIILHQAQGEKIEFRGDGECGTLWATLQQYVCQR